MPRYARGCGLLESDSFELTAFGQLAREHDPELAEPTTKWLMHYHLSAPHGPGPRFWHHLVAHGLRLGDTLTREAVAAEIATALTKAGERAPGERALGQTATVFLGSYTKTEGLGDLGLLAANGAGRYRVTTPAVPPPAALAAALADYWPAVFGGRVTVDLTELTQPGGFFSLFLLGGDGADEALWSLARTRLVELHRVAPPYQVARLWGDDGSPLEQAYDSV